MKLIGRDVRFVISAGGLKAGAFFNDVTFSEDSLTVDVGICSARKGQQRVDEYSATASIFASGFLDTQRGVPLKNNQLSGGSYWNFIDLAQVGRVVEVELTVAGNSRTPNTKLYKYKPWQISKASFKHGRRSASEDTIELIGTGGSVPDTYKPGMTRPWTNSEIIPG